MSSSVIGALRVNLGLDSSKFQGGLSKSEKALAGFSGRLTKMAAGLGAGIGAALTTRALGQAADQWSDMSSMVGNAIGSMSGAADVMDRIQDIASASYSDLGQTAQAFAANSQALKDLGLSTQQQLDYTEALNNALVISGAKGQQAAQVQDALSKAMATGKLSGDGLNTVLARGGRVAQALADELGTNVSGLRLMGAQGKITGDVIQASLLNRVKELADEAEDMPATIGDGMTKIRNGMTAIIGTFDQATGASGTLGATLSSIGDAMKDASKWIRQNGDTIISVMNQMVGVASAAAAVFATRYAVSIGTTAVAAMRAAVSQAMALEVALGATSRASALAGAASKAFAGALGVLRGAVMSLGIPALVVGVGMAVGKFLDLSRAAGGFGNAFALVMAAAKEEWSRWSAKLQAADAEFRAFGDGIKASIADAMAVTVEKVVWGVNRYVGAYRGAFGAIKAIWGALPRAIGDLVYQAANATIGGIEAMLKGAAGLIDKFTNSIAGSALGEKLGLSGTDIAGSINFTRLKNKYEGGMKDAGEGAADAFKEGFEADIFSADGVAGSLRDLADGYRDSADAWKGIGGIWSGIGAQPNEAWGAIKELVKGTGEVAATAADEVAEFSDALDGIGGKGGKSGGGGGSKERPFFEGAQTDILKLERQLQLVGRTKQEVAELEARWQMLDEAKRRGIPVNEALNTQISGYAARIGQLTGELERAEIAQQQFDEAVDGIADAFAGALVAGESLREGLGQVFKGIAADLIKSGIHRMISSLFLGGGGGLFGLRIPGFATGGQHGGGWRIVGERGPELEATGPARYFTATQTQQMLAGGGAADELDVRLYVDSGGNWQAEVARIAGRVSAAVVGETGRRQSDRSYLTGGA